MTGSLLALAGLGFWFAVIVLVLLFKRLKHDPAFALHCTALYRRVVGP